MDSIRKGGEDTPKISRYLVIAFSTAYAIQIIACRDARLGGLAGAASFSNWMAFCMLTPTVAAFFSGGKIKYMGWRLGLDDNWRALLFAWLSPTVFQLIGMALYYLVFPGDFDGSGSFLKEAAPGLYLNFERSGDSFAVFAFKEIIGSIASINAFVAIFWGLGEEIGWRGFLAPRMIERFGRAKGLILTGVIHGAWHFPLMLLIGYEYGKDYIGAPFLGLPAFCLFTTATGIISYALYEKTGSVWLPAILHGTINASFNPYMFGASERRDIFGPGFIGLISGLPIYACAAFILYRDVKRERGEELQDLDD